MMQTAKRALLALALSSCALPALAQMPQTYMDALGFPHTVVPTYSINGGSGSGGAVYGQNGTTTASINNTFPVNLYDANGQPVFGAESDAAWSGSGTASLIAVEKSIRGLLANTLTISGSVTTTPATGSIQGVSPSTGTANSDSNPFYVSRSTRYAETTTALNASQFFTGSNHTAPQGANYFRVTAYAYGGSYTLSILEYIAGGSSHYVVSTSACTASTVCTASVNVTGAGPYYVLITNGSTAMTALAAESSFTAN